MIATQNTSGDNSQRSVSKSIPRWSEFAKRHPIFYIPPFLMGGILTAFLMGQLAFTLGNRVVQLILATLSLLIIIAFTALTLYVLVTLAKSILEDKKKA